ncbi:MAG TPA: pyridoxine 5'-phosphate synthase [Gammaproteobacteria bacterium]|nr:pyridoxine 5'-phosphate synthase [Gammaproteobacteria bacterium]
MSSVEDIALGVNIDHVATLRQARGTSYPDPLEAVRIVEGAGADSITAHLREDRRHIQDRDIVEISKAIKTRLNLEMALTEEMLAFACRLKPQDCCLVPERRQELTTEGGLEVTSRVPLVREAIQRLAAAGIRVALFIDPDTRQVEAAAEAGAPVVELHTGTYADVGVERRPQELERLAIAARRAATLGIEVHAGHGLHFENVKPVAALPEITELNIGHAIISRAVLSGLATAVRDMKRLMLDART